MSLRKKLLIGTGVVLLLLGGLILKTLADAGEFKKISSHFSGSCERVTGVLSSEDIAVHPRTGMLFVSSDERRPEKHKKGELQGSIFGYDLKNSNPKLVNLTKNFKKTFRPHGISLWVGKDGRTSLFVISHPSGEHVVEIFDYKGGKLIHRRTIKNPELMFRPNDIVAVGHNSFYVSHSHGNKSRFGRTIENYLQLRKGYVLYFDGQTMHRAAAGFSFANGINVSPDGKRLYVATTIGQNLHVFHRDVRTGKLTQRKKIKLNTGLDNIDVDASGNIWIGAHPKLLTFSSHRAKPTRLSPSEVLKVTLHTNKPPKIQQTFLDDGSKISGSSVGVRYKKWLIVGGVLVPYFLKCQTAQSAPQKTPKRKNN